MFVQTKQQTNQRNIAVARYEKSPQTTEVSFSSNTKCTDLMCLLAIFSWLCCFITWKELKQNVHHRQRTKHVGKDQESVPLASIFHGSIDLPFPFTLKSVLSESSGFKSGFSKLSFVNGIAWTGGLTVQIKLRFQISPV